MTDQQTILLGNPPIVPVLDPIFKPSVLANHAFLRDVRASGDAVAVYIALERNVGSISRFSTEVFGANHPDASRNFHYVERLLKFLLWSRGGAFVHFCGPRELGDQLVRYYRETSTGRFDAGIMGGKIYERPFEVILCTEDELPGESEVSLPLGRHLEGCRIGFDLGASDRKVAAVIDGETVYSAEIPWSPRDQSDPQWHYDQINDGLREAARHLPRVDGIGGSSAGVLVDSQVKVASLFRGVPQELFETKVRDIFLELRAEWGVPFEVVNDGEVTALAGAMSIGKGGVLGIAMGSSEAAGYVDCNGNITGWLNELAFAPVDDSPQAPEDEWSGDRGVGALYFSQQCVGRLVKPAGIELPPTMPLPEVLEKVQELMANDDPRAEKIYQTIGVYLGYGIAHYADFYDFQYLLVLGRVTSGNGGKIIIEEARRVLDEIFPQLSESIQFHVISEKEKRHGQAMAAASLPVVTPVR